ncbi:hypothetical protein ACOME3_009416 [Neoechinorhynchus agilis]
MNRLKQRMYNSPLWRFLHRLRLRIKRTKCDPENDNFYETLSLRSDDEDACAPYLELTRSSTVRRKKTWHQNDCPNKRTSKTESIFTQRSLSDSLPGPVQFTANQSSRWKTDRFQS